jgi:GGDEF domain-containing protein
MVLFGFSVGYLRALIFQRLSNASIAGVIALSCIWPSALWAQQTPEPVDAGTAGPYGPTPVLVSPDRVQVIPAAVGAFTLPVMTPLDPGAIWQQTQTQGQVANASGVWAIQAGQRSAAKFSIATQNELIATLEFPLVRMDKVDLFWRVPGKAWSHAQAGDTVALSKWPLVSQHPTFLLHFETNPGQLDVVAVMQNQGFGETTALLSSDFASRERRLTQASIAGLLIGASAMVLLITLLMCALYRSTGSVYLLAYCACVTLAATVLTGYGAIWFTPEWPWFNDSVKPFASSVASITMLTASLAALDQGAVGARWRWTVRICAALLLIYAVAQMAVLPYTWRLVGGAGVGVLATVMGLAMGISSWRNGDRYAPWVMLAVVLFGLCVVAVSRGFVSVGGVDAYSMVVVTGMIASCLALRHVLMLRERFGKAVISRAATHRFRDPLTALLSYEGLEREVETLAVRQQTGGGAAHLLYFSLQALDSFKHEDGYLVWQRDLVRFAAVLQKVLGEDWHIARLSNSKFGAVRLQGRQKIVPEQLLTLVLTHCSRKIDTQDWVDRVGLRMAATSALLGKKALQELITTLDQDLHNLAPGKRIIIV